METKKEAENMRYVSVCECKRTAEDVINDIIACKILNGQ